MGSGGSKSTVTVAAATAKPEDVSTPGGFPKDLGTMSKEVDPKYDLIVDPDLQQNKWPAKIDDRKKSDQRRSLMIEVMTKEKFESLKEFKTKSGWTIARAINTGTQNLDSFVGCHAGDRESYKLFGDLFRPVIEAYHAGFSVDSKQHVTDLSADKITVDLSDSAKSKIRTTRFRCARNLNWFPLNTCGTKETRLEIAALMENVFAALTGDLKGKFHRHTVLTDEERQALIDKHYLFRGGDKMQAASGYHLHWPHGRGIYVSEDERALSWINEGDHIRVISIAKGGDIRAVFGHMGHLVAAMEEEIRKQSGQEQVFMCDPILGMITCCPSNLGTGMRGSVHMRIPKLIQKMGLEKVDEMAKTKNCQARGTSGEHSEVTDHVDVSNLRRLGFPEYQLAQDMIECVNWFSEMEDEL